MTNPLPPGHVRPRPILAEHARAQHTIIRTDELQALEEKAARVDALAVELTAAQMSIGEQPFWIDPACGCTRSPDVARDVPCPDHAGIADRGIGCWPPYGQMPGDEGYVPEDRDELGRVIAQTSVSEPVSRRWRVVVHMLPDVATGTSDVISGAWTPGPVNVEAHAEWLTDRLSHGAPWIATLMSDDLARVVNVHDIDHVDVELEIPF